MTMLAAFYERCGASHEVLAVQEIPRPEPGAGEVLVRLSLSGVNPTDWKARAKYEPEFVFQVPNQDGVGVVEAVGDGVDGSLVGERVWVYFAAWRRQWGTAAQWTVVPTEQAVPLPEGASDELGASLGIPALTAHRCVFADGPVAGLTVLVAGGAGAVGHAAIELARWGGARVIATASTDEKAALARAAGADAVVDYRREDAAEEIRAAAPRGVDRVVEVSPARNLDLDLEVCAPGAAIGAYATDGGTEAPVPFMRLMRANTTLRFVPRLHDAGARITPSNRRRGADPAGGSAHRPSRPSIRPRPHRRRTRCRRARSSGKGRRRHPVGQSRRNAHDRRNDRARYR